MFETEEIAQPTLPPQVFDSIRESISKNGPNVAIDQLCDELKKINDYQSLFYALLMKKRVELGVSPFPTGAAADLPASTHEAYENAIRDAGRYVGGELLKQNDLRKAWFYFNMLGEIGPVREYLEKAQPGLEEDVQPLIEIALYHGVYPEKGFDLVVERYGICNAITTYSGQNFGPIPAAKQHAIRKLVSSIHEQLRDRLRNDLENRGIKTTDKDTISSMLRDYPEVMEEGGYHVDTSHLSSITQFSLELDECPERQLAIELCEYGSKLTAGLQYPSDPPFENTYADYLVLLKVMEGQDVEAGLKHFYDKIEPAHAEGTSFPAEVYVNLLLKLGNRDEALRISKLFLAGENRQLSCPGVYELCQQSGDFEGLAQSAQSRHDGVSFVAALIAKNKS